MAALSTRVTFKPFFFAQYDASTAAPQAAIPPPQISTSVSTVTVSKSAIFAYLLKSSSAEEIRVSTQTVSD
jgi:hypothetical protein